MTFILLTIYNVSFAQHHYSYSFGKTLFQHCLQLLLVITDITS